MLISKVTSFNQTWLNETQCLTNESNAEIYDRNVKLKSNITSNLVQVLRNNKRANFILIFEKLFILFKFGTNMIRNDSQQAAVSRKIST